MKTLCATLAVAFLLAPGSAWAHEALAAGRIQATFEDSGAWEMTDTAVGTTWRGEWLSPALMKVSGTDGSCFILTEYESGLAQLACGDLRKLSILVSH